MAATDYFHPFDWEDDPDPGPIQRKRDGPMPPAHNCRDCGRDRRTLYWVFEQSLHWRLYDVETDKPHSLTCGQPDPQPKPKKGKFSMDKNIAALMREDAHTVHVKFAPGDRQKYTYVASKSLGLKVDDTVVVMTENGLWVATIKTCDDTVIITPGDERTYKWVIDKVDMAAYEADMKRNEEIERITAAAMRTNMRSSFAHNVISAVTGHERDALLKLLGVQSVQAIDIDSAGDVKS